MNQLQIQCMASALQTRTETATPRSSVFAYFGGHELVVEKFHTIS